MMGSRLISSQVISVDFYLRFDANERHYKYLYKVTLGIILNQASRKPLRPTGRKQPVVSVSTFAVNVQACATSPSVDDANLMATNVSNPFFLRHANSP